MMGKKAYFVFSILIVSLILCSFVSAITGSLGNARMVLRADVGDSIDKYLTIKNVNDIPITIEIAASGDLEDYIKIKESNFTLSPGEERKADFTVYVAKNGTTETKLNVKYSQEKGSGVGLSSTVIVIANGDDSDIDEDDFDIEDAGNEDSGISNTLTNINSRIKSSFSSPVLIAGLVTFFILIIFLILLIIYYKKSRTKEKINRKRADRSS